MIKIKVLRSEAAVDDAAQGHASEDTQEPTGFPTTETKLATPNRVKHLRDHCTPCGNAQTNSLDIIRRYSKNDWVSTEAGYPQAGQSFVMCILWVTSELALRILHNRTHKHKKLQVPRGLHLTLALHRRRRSCWDCWSWWRVFVRLLFCGMIIRGLRISVFFGKSKFTLLPCTESNSM